MEFVQQIKNGLLKRGSSSQNPKSYWVSKYTIVYEIFWKENKLPSCTFSRQEIATEKAIFGPDIGSFERKTTRKPILYQLASICPYQNNTKI